MLGLMILLLISHAAIAQEGIESDEEGTFSARVSGRSIADTLHASGMNLVWTQHRGAVRTVCDGDLNDIGHEVGWSPGFLSWRCTGAKQDSAFVEYDLASDVWKLGSNVFLRVGKKVWADDLLPRAVQPPKAYGDSVVLAVRQLYEWVNKVPCADSSPEGDVRTFKVCSTGHTVWRILRSWGAEAYWVRDEFTFDSTGSLRFVYERSSSGTPRFPEKPYRRYYFAGDRLVRITISDGTHGDTIWNASVRSWGDAEKRLLGESKDAMVDARN
jgi:hypothetical protein